MLLIVMTAACAASTKAETVGWMDGMIGSLAHLVANLVG